jgi:DNA-binding CsgD family transcriptional regulator
MTTCAVTAGAGRFRSYRLHDGFVDLAAFRRTTHYQALYEGGGISDRMWVACPIGKDAEAYYLFDLYNTRRRFSEAEEALAADTLRGLKWLHRAVMLSYGLLTARTALTPVQRKLLSELLTEKTEKEIARKLGLTPGTTHQYVVALCKKLGVNGRAGLLAAWLGRPPPTTTDQ